VVPNLQPYLEEYGWEPGTLLVLAFPQSLTAALGLGWAEREDRVSKRLSVSWGAECAERLQFATRTEIFSRVGHRGVVASARVSTSDSAEHHRIGAEATFLRYELRRLSYLTEQDWDKGNVGGLVLGLDGEVLTFIGGSESHLAWDSHFSLAGGGLAGDFANRQLTGRLHWWQGEWEARLTVGIADGRIPAQHLFDAGIDGNIVGIPIREFRGRDIKSLNIERRQRVVSDFFVRLCGVAVGVGGVNGPMSELKISVTVEDSDFQLYPDGMLFRFDFPLYSSHADQRGGELRKWDLRRFGFRLSLPWLPFVGREEQTRYRYISR